ncbi:DUF433 domain-containing protein [Roseofilum sp. BLCC_M154]|jgi:uncharacterized protein (DUF433 family)|uniref:DUF433 domain-containing protein n=1 Tax=Roseofilum acuticapitatum BLCC-M154 TaxID=3022444 RepID=A0ABT7AUE0_9CYAN|nr:DUF433 domain-containing protein [Roseofilum acuticapitatum]MDJ1169926.1 DUF433 domain-containing protein [Roseofilum acuticapitatum BLCC-M154]
MVAVISEHIQILPGLCGGQPHIAGHRIKVQDIVIWHDDMGMSPDEIVYHYPSITLADVYAALTYYHDHREEIRQQIRSDQAWVRQIQEQNPSVLKEKLKNRNAPGNSVSFG